MSAFALSRCGLSVSVAAALLAGCGGSQPPIGAPGAMAQSRSLVLPAQHGRDLLYVSADTATNIYTYPRGKLFSELGGSTGVVCSNAAGHVFLSQVNVDVVDEYQHGRSTPIAELSDPFGNPESCSADGSSGNLALVSQQGAAIYRPGKRHRWHLPKLYMLGQNLFSCGYDASGDLFIDGKTQNNGIIFAELPKGGSKFKNITLDHELTIPGTVQWDGQYLAVGDQENTLIHRFSIQGSKGTQIGFVVLSGPSSVTQFWVQDSIVIGADTFNSQVGFWKYPDGGSEIMSLKVSSPLGATVSAVRK
ncbi:MAG: hypothetical protein WA814_04540 [Candidatus Baltobacteraceae bacterium]